jgi:hypothetical protein
MRFQFERHLRTLLGEARQPAAAKLLRAQAIKAGKECPSVPPEFNHRDYVVYLLHVDAAIEHALMVQYLYAAYSLGGPQVPAEFHATVSGWQEVILGIAKEEMAHLISVQNVLRLIGGPLSLAREDFPWDCPFFPFPFALEPLTLDSLAKYVYAESPVDWKGPLADEIKNKVLQADPNPHRVGELFALLLGLLKNRDFIADETFQPSTYSFQASWDEWGRGYKGGARGNQGGTGRPGTPDLLVVPLSSRDDAVKALKLISEQGEATSQTQNNGEQSHFQRFLDVYVAMRDTAKDWSASRPVALNPYVALGDFCEDLPNATPITHPEAQAWATLFNIRYRMLLNLLLHSFTLDGGLNQAGAWTPRGLIISTVFGEMYNLRAISQFLVQTPVAEGSTTLAGPPFMMPYTLDLPQAEADRWRLHVDVATASTHLATKLLSLSPAEHHGYLYALQENDRAFLKSAKRILADASTSHAPI